MINIKTPEEILNTPHYAAKTKGSKIYRDGIELEKGAALSARKIEDKMALFKKYAWYWSIYPDRLVIGA